MSKKKPKAKGYSEEPSPAADAPRPPAVMISRLPGVVIGLEWTSILPTMTCVFEWTGEDWRYVRSLNKDHLAITPPALDRVAFPGRYAGERVLAVYTPPDTTGE